MARRIRGTVYEKSSAVLLARARLPTTGALVTQASLSAITYEVHEVSRTPFTQTRASTAITIATSVFDTLQNDGRWNLDAVGYNFLFIAPGADFPTAVVEERRNQRFWVDIKMTVAGTGEIIRFGYDLDAVKVPSVT